MATGVLGTPEPGFNHVEVDLVSTVAMSSVHLPSWEHASRVPSGMAPSDSPNVH